MLQWFCVKKCVKQSFSFYKYAHIMRTLEGLFIYGRKSFFGDLFVLIKQASSIERLRKSVRLAVGDVLPFRRRPSVHHFSPRFFITVAG